MTAPEPQTPSWDGVLGRAPDYKRPLLLIVLFGPTCRNAFRATLIRGVREIPRPLTISWSGSHALALPALLDHEERRSDLNARSCSAPGGHSGWR